MQVTLLGTSATFPTKHRNHTAVLLKYGGESLLFDCGEGTQRQLRIAEESPMKITKIFISHWHGDHVLGLIGLLASMGMNRRTTPVDLYGPKNSKVRLEHLYHGFGFHPGFPLRVHEIDPRGVQSICKGDSYQVFAAKMKHPIPCLGFAFQENDKLRINTQYIEKFGLTQDPILKKLQAGKDIMWKGKKISAKQATYTVQGKKFAFVVDSEKTPVIADLAKDADVFVCEGTFSNKIQADAREKGHMTVKQAAQLAKKARVKKLVLFHFSQRYKSVGELEKEAKSIFKNVVMGKDFLKISV